MAERGVKPKAFVVGVGMTKFERPHARGDWEYHDMGREAAESALQDAAVSYHQVQAVVASYCYGDPACGQKAVYGLGLTGVPVFNVNNNCSSGSSALMMARLMVQGGYDCTLAVGFEKMDFGLSENFTDRESPIYQHIQSLHSLGAPPGPLNKHINEVTSEVLKMFAYAARDHSRQYGTTAEHFAKIASKNRQHGIHNPRAIFQKPISPSEVLSKRMMCEPITIAMSAPTGCGGAAAIVCSEDFVRRNHLENQAVEITAQHMCSDLHDSFGRDFLSLCGYYMSQRAARLCYHDTGLGPGDLDVVEVHDCFAPNELFQYEALGLCGEGGGGALVDSAVWVPNRNGGKVCQIGGRWVVNPSGGLESKGHPIGATGLAQCAEICWQLRGLAGRRQVDEAKVALQQNFGIGGAAVVTMYQKMSGPHTQRAKL